MIANPLHLTKSLTLGPFDAYHWLSHPRLNQNALLWGIKSSFIIHHPCFSRHEVSLHFVWALFLSVFFLQNFNIIVIFKWRLFIYLFFIFRFANWYMVCWISNIVIYVFPLFFPSRYIYLVCNWFVFIYFLGSLSWCLAIFFKYLTRPLIYHIALCFSSTLYKSKIIKFYIIKRSILVSSPFGFKFTRDPS